MIEMRNKNVRRKNKCSKKQDVKEEMVRRKGQKVKEVGEGKDEKGGERKYDKRE